MLADDFPGSAATVSILIYLADETKFGAVVGQTTAFVARWFTALHAARHLCRVGDVASSTVMSRQLRILNTLEVVLASGLRSIILLVAYSGKRPWPRPVRTSGRSGASPDRSTPFRLPNQWEREFGCSVGASTPVPLDSNRLAAYLAPLVSWNQLELYAFRVEAEKRQKEQLASRPPNASIQEAAAAVLREAEERVRGDERSAKAGPDSRPEEPRSRRHL